MTRLTRRTWCALGCVRQFLERHGVWLWPVAALLFATSFALHERAQLARIAGVLRGADPRWVAGAVLIELAALWLTALTYQTLLHRLGHRVAWPALARLHLQRVVVGTVTPVGGPPSLWVLVRTLQRRGVPADDALLAASLRSAVGYAAFLLLLVPTLLLHDPSGQVMIGAALTAALFCAYAGGSSSSSVDPGAAAACRSRSAAVSSAPATTAFAPATWCGRSASR